VLRNRGVNATTVSTATEKPGASRAAVVSALGITQILAWGSSYYLPAVLAAPIVAATGWSLGWVIGGLSMGLFISGAVAPAVGRAIERWGGRPVLIGSAVLLAAGLGGLALADGLPVYLLSWAIIGLGMGAGLYDAAFAMLGRRYGASARSTITVLTLWGGFASTVCWPLSALLVEALGWRGTCLAYAAIHLVIALPLYVFVLPREEERPVRSPEASPDAAPSSGGQQPNTAADRPMLFVLLATGVTLGAVISTVLSVHLLTMLQARDVALGRAVALGALVGPAQVGARLIEMFLGRHYHPIWTMLASTILIAAGMGILLSGSPIIAAGLVLYGAGIGIKSIARGTLPLALYGATGYAVLMGRLAMPSQVAQALSPTVGALLLDQFDATTTLAVLTSLATINVASVVALWTYARPHRHA
jgi:MFS family permease